jgi:polar amino acid transport system substrate-binding protein
MQSVPPPDVLHDIAPSGTLRVAINLGNSILAQRDAESGELSGVSVFLARELTRLLQIDCRLDLFNSAGDVFRAFEDGSLDVGFLAIDQTRAATLAFTTPYVIIEGSFVVSADSEIKSPDDVDREGIQISVGHGSAYDLHLSRTLKHASLLSAPTSADALNLLLEKKVRVAAGVKQMIQSVIRDCTGFRILDLAFMDIRQAVCCLKDRVLAYQYLDSLVSGMRREGVIKAYLSATGQGDLAAP